MGEVGAVERATGRSRSQWFAALDRWGAPGRPYREIADWLIGEHDLSRWWAQKLIVEYEQERGIRPPGIRRDGTFEVSASKTVEVPAGELLASFADPRRRRRWMSGFSMRLLESKGRVARFSCPDGSRVTVTITSKGRTKSSVVVAQDRLTDGTKAQQLKMLWRERLVDLKQSLES